MCVINLDLSKAESQALTNYGSGEDENEDEEMEDFEESPVDVQTSLQANTETTEENEHDSQVFCYKHLSCLSHWTQESSESYQSVRFSTIIFIIRKTFIEKLVHLFRPRYVT